MDPTDDVDGLGKSRTYRDSISGPDNAIPAHTKKRPHKYSSNKFARPCDTVKKVKCTLVQALRLCIGRTAHNGSRGIALLFLDHGTSRG